MNKIVLYAHGGSKNHGCEALVRTTAEFMKSLSGEYPDVISSHPEEDRAYINNIKLNIIQKGSSLGVLQKIIAKIWRTITKSLYFYDKAEMKAIVCDAKDSLCISIGGDNYCYADFDYYGRMNTYLLRNNNKTVLWGCSVEPDSLNNVQMIDDLKRYSLITARESLTFEAMRKAGLSNIRYCPDSAFLLPVEVVSLPNIFEKDVVGINISPLVMSYEESNGIVFENYRTLIRYILENSEMNIALIPHVIWEHNNDLEPLRLLYNEFRETGRIEIIDRNEEYNCCQLKFIVSKCKFLVTARTHASIAGYSTGVPTLVTGYSVKAKGIAKDIFGDYKEFVCPVQQFQKDDDLLNGFLYMVEHRKEMIEKEKKYNSQIADKFSEIKQELGRIYFEKN